MRDIDIFNGLMRANPYLLALDVLLLAHFAYSYYRHCYLEGFKVDFWHFTAFISFVIPFLLIYPFAGSAVNVFTIGAKIYRVRDFVDKAYLLSILGYICTYIGFYYFNLTRKRSVLYTLSDGFNRRFGQYLFNCIDSKASIYVCGFFGLLPAGAFLGIAFAKYGITPNLRSATLADPLMRAFFNLVLAGYVPIIGTFLLMRYLQYKERAPLILFAVFFAVMLFSGSRGAALAPVLTAIIFYFISKQLRVSLAKYVVAGFLLLIIAFYLKDVRNERFAPVQTLRLAPYSVVYGSNFSDIRDFAWVLANWDDEYILGRSYLAAGLAWVPRGLSEFREKWSMGMYIIRLLGLDPSLTTPMRPGKFGEPYLNFGLIGIVMMGFIGGYVLRYVDIKIKEAVQTKGGNFIEMYALTFVYTFVSQFYLSGRFRRFYALIALLALGYLIRQLATLLPHGRKNENIS